MSRQKTIVVTGGLGYIGSHVVVELAASGYTPIIIDNLVNSSREVLGAINKLAGQSVTFYKGDYQDTSLLDTIMTTHRPDGFIHFAAYKQVGESVEKPLTYYHNNVGGLITLLERITDSGRPIGFVFSSSCTVYGESDTQPIPESAPFKPAASPYGATKQMGETIISDTTKAHANLSSVALRYFNPIGAHPSGEIGELPPDVPATIVPYITQTASGQREVLTIFGGDYSTPDGTCIRDYIHVVDLARAHIKALELSLDTDTARKTMRAFNIGTGTGTSVLELVRAFEKATGLAVPYRIGDRRPGDIVTAYANPAIARQALGWQATLSIEDALRDAWNWQQRFDARQANAS